MVTADIIWGGVASLMRCSNTCLCVCTPECRAWSLAAVQALPLALVLGSKLESIGCIAYVHLDLGLVSVGKAAMRWLTPLVRQAMTMTRGLVSGIAVAVAHVTDAVFRAAALGIARLCKWAWKHVVMPAQHAVRSSVRSSVLAVWNNPEVGLAAAAACIGFAVLSHGRGWGAAAWLVTERTMQQVRQH